MNRAILEAESIARRHGWRDGAAGELERRARDRRHAKLGADFDRELALEQRAADRRAADRPCVGDWIARYEAVRREVTSQGL